MTTKNEIGQFLKNVREQNSVGKFYITERTGLQNRQISNIEEASSSYTIDSLLLYLNAFDLEVIIAKKK